MFRITNYDFFASMCGEENGSWSFFKAGIRKYFSISLLKLARFEIIFEDLFHVAISMENILWGIFI